MALIRSLLLGACLMIVPLTIRASPNYQYPEDQQRFSNHRMAWPLWYQERHMRGQHDGKQVFQEITTTTRSPRNRKDSTERPIGTIAPRLLQNRGSKSQPEQHLHEQRPGALRPEKFSAVAVTEYSGTRAIAYAGYHNNHRHQPRETGIQGYQRVATTSPNYTRHHPGLVYTELSSGFLCCPGWSQVTHLSFGCNKPTCPAPCLNGGICSSPGKCSCPKGFTGHQCQTDVDECVTEKPCGQLCRNLPGSYECYCRPGFQLQPDGQSCRKNDSDGTAFEAKDLENDFEDVTTTTTRRPSTTSHDTENEVGDADLDQDYEIILKRLTKLEKQIAKGRKRETEASEMSAKITSAVESINEVKRAVENVQLMQQEIYDMRSKMKEYELETRKIHHLTNRVAELEGRLRLRYNSLGL